MWRLVGLFLVPPILIQTKRCQPLVLPCVFNFILLQRGFLINNAQAADARDVCTYIQKGNPRAFHTVYWCNEDVMRVAVATHTSQRSRSHEDGFRIGQVQDNYTCYQMITSVELPAWQESCRRSQSYSTRQSSKYMMIWQESCHFSLYDWQDSSSSLRRNRIGQYYKIPDRTVLQNSTDGGVQVPKIFVKQTSHRIFKHILEYQMQLKK